MPIITAAHAHAGPAELHVEDHTEGRTRDHTQEHAGDHVGDDAPDHVTRRGPGRPVVLIHGYPLDARFWERQVPALLAAGHRVVAYDRRGFGRSVPSPSASAPLADGADFDTFAADLDAVLTALDLTDVILVGHGMGSGEVVRYLRSYGAARIAGAALLAPLPPFLLRTSQTPHGLDLAHFDAQIADARQDPTGFLTAFVRDLFGETADPALETAVETWTALATTLPPRTCAAAIPTWITDFRDDIAALGLPTLIVHGTDDRILPVEATGRLLHDLLPDAAYVEVDGAPHGLIWTHADAVNHALARFATSW